MHANLKHLEWITRCPDICEIPLRVRVSVHETPFVCWFICMQAEHTYKFECVTLCRVICVWVSNLHYLQGAAENGSVISLPALKHTWNVDKEQQDEEIGLEAGRCCLRCRKLVRTEQKKDIFRVSLLLIKSWSGSSAVAGKCPITDKHCSTRRRKKSHAL